MRCVSLRDSKIYWISLLLKIYCILPLLCMCGIGFATIMHTHFIKGLIKVLTGFNFNIPDPFCVLLNLDDALFSPGTPEFYIACIWMSMALWLIFSIFCESDLEEWAKKHFCQWLEEQFGITSLKIVYSRNTMSNLPPYGSSKAIWTSPDGRRIKGKLIRYGHQFYLESDKAVIVKRMMLRM